MAMRPRGGGARSGGVRPVYEDFRPVSEWKEDDDYILNIYLPGFMKEHVKVSTDGRNTIRVLAERLVAGNKWNRFQEDYQVPENGEMNSVRSNCQGGVLTVTIPKVKAPAIPPKAEAVNDTQKPQKGREKVVSDTSTIQKTDEKGTEPQKPSSDSTIQNVGGDKKGQDKAFPAIGTSQSKEEKSLDPKNSPTDHHGEHDQDSHQRGRSFTPLNGTVVSHDAVKKESDESKEKQIASERPDGTSKPTKAKEGKKTTSGKELPDVETARQAKLEKDGTMGVPEKKEENKELYGAFPKEKHMKVVKGITELNEERQLLVNMGAAMLVIVALTTYVTYGFASAKDKN